MNKLHVVHLTSIARARTKPKPRSNAVRRDRAERPQKSWDFSHLIPAPEPIDDEPHMGRAEIDRGWDRAMLAVTGRRRDAGKKTKAAARWDRLMQAVARRPQ
jgi:hypothetical protein